MTRSLIIGAGLYGGYIVWRDNTRQLGMTHDLLFAGSLDDCLSFIREQMMKPLEIKEKL